MTSIINSHIAEVKSIHDKFDTSLRDQDSDPRLKMTLDDLQGRMAAKVGGRLSMKRTCV